MVPPPSGTHFSAAPSLRPEDEEEIAAALFNLAHAGQANDRVPKKEADEANPKVVGTRKRQRKPPRAAVDYESSIEMLEDDDEWDAEDEYIAKRRGAQRSRGTERISSLHGSEKGRATGPGNNDGALSRLQHQPQRSNLQYMSQMPPVPGPAAPPTPLRPQVKRGLNQLIVSQFIQWHRSNRGPSFHPSSSGAMRPPIAGLASGQPGPYTAPWSAPPPMPGPPRSPFDPAHKPSVDGRFASFVGQPPLPRPVAVSHAPGMPMPSGRPRPPMLPGGSLPLNASSIAALLPALQQIRGPWPPQGPPMPKAPGTSAQISGLANAVAQAVASQATAAPRPPQNRPLSDIAALLQQVVARQAFAQGHGRPQPPMMPPSPPVAHFRPPVPPPSVGPVATGVPVGSGGGPQVAQVTPLALHTLRALINANAQRTQATPPSGSLPTNPDEFIKLLKLSLQGMKGQPVPQVNPAGAPPVALALPVEHSTAQMDGCVLATEGKLENESDFAGEPSEVKGEDGVPANAALLSEGANTVHSTVVQREGGEQAGNNATMAGPALAGQVPQLPGFQSIQPGTGLNRDAVQLLLQKYAANLSQQTDGDAPGKIESEGPETRAAEEHEPTAAANPIP